MANKFQINQDEIIESMKDEQKEREEKIREIRKTGRTQGNRMGISLKRVNFGTRDEIYNYLHFEARRRGMTISGFINYIIEEYYASENAYLSDDALKQSWKPPISE